MLPPKLKRLAAKSSEAAMYCSRSKAIRKLNLDLPDFRKLCILKGIFPWVPKTHKLSKDRVWYLVKDIKHLAREPVLAKFRAERTMVRKVTKALSRKDPLKARRLENKRKDLAAIDISPILLERYPSLLDAIRDLDDALSLVALFAACPPREQESIEGDAISESRELMDHWMAFIAETGALTKTFASIKGFYYEAELLGQKIVWLMPHEFSNADISDVDFKVMGSFLLLYRRLLKFVMFKLFRMSGFVYPPKAKTDVKLSAGRFLALEIERDGFGMQTITDSDDREVALFSRDAAALRRRGLFRHQIVYLNREVPVFHLAFLLKAGGVKNLGFDEVVAEQCVSPLKADDLSITHHIMDRPLTAFEKYKSKTSNEIIAARSYVQPQWVLDSFNMNSLLPLNPYALGEVCPPHLSPFGDDLGHVPEHQQVLENWAGYVDEGTVPLPETRDDELPDRVDADAETVAPSGDADEEQESVPDEEGPSPQLDDELNPTAGEPEAKFTPVTPAEKERARLLLSHSKQRLYKKLRSGEKVREAAKHKLQKKAATLRK